ncbi:hypothetical protein Chor_016674, partial [Crotalus horridus]
IFYFFHHGPYARQKELDVRLDYELCPDEQVFIQKRKKIVAAALKRVLCMDNDLQDHEKLNLLDCLTYISGSSGSAWTLSNLYEEPDWSQKDLLGPIADARKNMSKCKLDCFTLDHLKEYCDILKQRQKDGYKTCITDLWGLFIDQALGNGVIDVSVLLNGSDRRLNIHAGKSKQCKQHHNSLNVHCTNLVWG